MANRHVRWYSREDKQSQAAHQLEGKWQVQRPTADEIDCVIHANAVLQAMVSIPSTFGELAKSVMEQLPRSSCVDFVTDSYLLYSIKGIERSRRGTSTPHLVSGPMTKVPRD